MKKLFYLFAITIALCIFTSLNANAATSTNSSNSDRGFLSEIFDLLFDGNSNSNSNANNNSPNGNPASASTQLPIDNGAVYLLIAGIIIGIVIVKKYKAGAIENQI